MKQATTFLCILLLCLPMGAADTSVIKCDLYVDCNIANGTQISAANALTVSHGQGGVWTDNNTPNAFFTGTNTFKDLPNPVMASGIVYKAGSVANCFQVSCLTNSTYVKYTFNAVPKASFGFWCKMDLNVSTTDFNLITLVSPGGGDFLSFAVKDGLSVGQQSCGAETASGQTQDHLFVITNQTWIWVTGQYVQNGNGTISIYSTNLTLLATTNAPISDLACDNLRIGRQDAHANFSAQNAYFSNVLLDLNGNFPLGPNGPLTTVDTNMLVTISGTASLTGTSSIK